MPSLADRRTTALRAAGASTSDITIVELVMTSLSPHPNLFSVLSSAPTAAQAVPWAFEVAEQHQSLGQPIPNQTKATIQGALSALDSLPAPNTLTASRWRAWLSDLDQDLSRAVPPSEDVSPTALLKEQLAVSGSLSADGIARIAREVAVVLSSFAVSDVEYDQLILNKTASPDGWTTVSIVDAVTSAPARDFIVLLGITGVSAEIKYTPNFRSGSLEHFDPDSSGAYANWGAAGGDAAETVRALRCHQLHLPHLPPRSSGPSLFLEGTYSARSRSAAIRAAIQEAEQLAARIALAHPRADPEVFPVVLLSERQVGKLVVHDSSAPHLNRVRLAAPNWTALSGAQEAALRSRGPRNGAHRASLSWVSLEVLGIAGGFGPKAVTLENLSKALALHQLRQLVTLSYRTLVSTVGANSDQSARLSARAADLRRGARKRMKQADNYAGNPDGHYLSAARYQMLSSLLALQCQLQSDEADSKRQTIRAMNLSPATEGNMTRMVFLSDAPGWIGHLRNDTPELQTLLVAAPLATRNLVTRAQAALASPTSISAHLKSGQTWLNQQVRNLYVIRNMHLHAGLQDLPTDSIMAEFGTQAIDALYEILDLWPNESSDDAGSVQLVLDQLAGVWDQVTSSACQTDIRTYVDTMLTPEGI